MSLTTSSSRGVSGSSGVVSPRLALFALSGLFQGPVFGALLVTRDRQSPPDVRGQVFAIGAGAKITATAAGAALGGALAGVSSGGQLLLAGAWPVLAGAVGLAVLRRSRPVPDGAPVQLPRPLTAARTTSGTGTGRRVAASTYTCTNRPSADGSSSPARNTASR